MSNYTPTTEDVREDFAFPWSPEQIGDRPARVAAFDRWLAAHDAEVRASVLAEQGEPEWEMERVEEARIYYRYGVNSGTLYARNTPSSIAAAVEQQQRVTMGRIGVEKVEARTRVTRTSPWLPVEENKPESTDGSER